MLEREGLISLPADALVSALIKTHPVRSFTIEAYVPKTHRQFDERFECDSGVNLFQVVSDLKLSHDNRYAFSFFSQVRTDTGLMHFPMLDFSNSQYDYGVERVKEVVCDLGEEEGAILSSGRSYHYYGFNLISSESWRDLLSRAAGYKEIGVKYIGHQLEAGGCSLRLTTTECKPQVPIVINVFSCLANPS
jgi:hypothetical protein